ncbi:MAG: hypothetical protein LQ348_002165 [Seirophora lacunosa]|nr:MAG: hypothetical protein LQ348_002165 [Seirophora lacunosa]
MRALEPLFLLAVSAGAAALTCLLEMLYLCLRRQTYRRSSLQSHTKAICYLLLRMSGDACAAVLWFSAFVAALLPKRPDYRGFLQSPPYATWVASAVLALTEWYVVFEFNPHYIPCFFKVEVSLSHCTNLRQAINISMHVPALALG